VNASLWLRLALLAALGTACGEQPAVYRASADGAGEAGTDPCAPEPALPSTEEAGAGMSRGEYLVRHVSACGECHTPHRIDGRLDESRWLAGVLDFEDLDPSDDTKGAIHAPNLTPDPSGLGSWNDDEIVSAFLDGMAPGGVPLSPVMPYYVFHNMSDDDAREILLYLRSVPSVFHLVPPRQPLPVPLTAPAEPLPESAIPEPLLATDHACHDRAQNGRYLAGKVAACAHCHTEPAPAGSAHAVLLDKLFMGRRPFIPGHNGLALEDPTVRILSRNLTPHPNGIEEWTPEQIATALRTGQTPNGLGLCPPMPAGETASYGGMRLEDARDIGVYLLNLEPRDNGEIPLCCSSCHQPRDD
jgi:hypothetical protein